MPDPIFSDETASPVRSLRDRLGGNAEERLGRALSELLESPLFTGAIGRAFDAREKAAQAQEVALGALNLPSAADIERLTRRIRSLSQRLEAIEDGVERLDTSRLVERRGPVELEARLDRVEQQLDGLLGKLDVLLTRIQRPPAQPASPAASASPASTAQPKAAAGGGKPNAAGGAKPQAAANTKPKAAAKAKSSTAKAKPSTAKAKPKAAKAKSSTAKAKPSTAKAKPKAVKAKPGATAKARPKAATAKSKAAPAPHKIRAAQAKAGGARKR